MFQLNSGNAFYRGITSSEIQEWVEEHEGDGKVSLLLNVFCVEVEKIISVEKLKEKIDFYTRKKVLNRVVINFDYPDAMLYYQFEFNPYNNKVEFDTQVVHH